MTQIIIYTEMLTNIGFTFTLLADPNGSVMSL